MSGVGLALVLVGVFALPVATGFAPLGWQLRRTRGRPGLVALWAVATLAMTTASVFQFFRTSSGGRPDMLVLSVVGLAAVYGFSFGGAALALDLRARSAADDPSLLAKMGLGLGGFLAGFAAFQVLWVLFGNAVVAMLAA